MATFDLQYTTVKKPLPGFIVEALPPFSANANIYQAQPEVLVEKIAALHAFSSEQIFLTAGNDEAIHIFLKTYGKKTLIFPPTYSVYTDAEYMGGSLMIEESYSEENGYQIPVKAYPEATLIFIANPNNPFGETSQENLQELIRLNPQAIVCIDEAYAGFVDYSMLPLVPQYKNLAVFRSFSKDYGMAGNRVAYVVAQPSVVKDVSLRTQWANVSYLSVGAAVAALEHQDYFSQVRGEIIETREAFTAFLKDQGFMVIPSKINAVSIRFNTEDEAASFVSFLLENEVHVTHGNGGSNTGVSKQFIRFAIHTPEVMKQAQDIISRYRR